MSVIPMNPKPDLGPVLMFPNPADPESPLINVAGVVDIAAQGETPEARRLYSTFLTAWARWKHLPRSDNDRQAGALDDAMAAVGITVKLIPVPSG